MNAVPAAATGGTATGTIGLLQTAILVQGIAYLVGGLVFGITLYRAGVLARWAAAVEGSSRNAYIVRVRTEHVAQVRPVATVEAFRQAADLAADLGDEGVMHAACS